MPTTLDLLIAGSTLPAGAGYTTEEHLENLGAITAQLTIVHELPVAVDAPRDVPVQLAPDPPVELQIADSDIQVSQDKTTIEIEGEEDAVEVR